MENDYDDSGEERCLECGDRIGYGRKGRKFCSRTCKNHYHNRQAKTSREFKSRIIAVLERNYDILNLLMGGSALVGTPELRRLEEVGFEPGCFTSYSRSGNLEIFSCFDLDYTVEDGRIISVSRMSGPDLYTE